MRRSPIHVARHAGGPYRSAALQRSCVLARLMCGPASKAELEQGCRVPSVTKRISELRAGGFPIVGGWAIVTGPDGTATATMVYALAACDQSQGDLFGASGAA